MMRRTLSDRAISRGLATVTAVVVASACAVGDGTGPTDTDAPITASVVAYDASAPAAPGGMPAGTAITLEGSVTATGLTVELWNGTAWLTVVDQMASATFAVGDATVQTTLVPASEIPAGTYSKARLTAQGATLDLSIAAQGQEFQARVATATAGPLTIEKDIEVVEHADGSRTFRMALVAASGLTLRNDANGVALVVSGDFGTAALARVGFTASVVMADASGPVDVAGRTATLEGTVTMEGLTVELWNGDAWLVVLDQMGTAAVTIGDVSAEATLMPADEIAAGTYTKSRLTANNARVDLAVTVDGQRHEGAIAVGGTPAIVIEKDVEVTVNEDGSRTFRIALEAVARVSVGPAGLVVEGDFGTAALARVGLTASVVMADASAPAGDAASTTSVEGSVTVEGLSVELWDGEAWLLVVDQMATAEVLIGDATAEATLMPADEIAEGTYTRARLTANRARLDIAVIVDGERHEAAIEVGGEHTVVVEKDIEVIENEDGSRTFRIALEAVQHMAVEAGGVRVAGDFGEHLVP